ncbi:lysozyme [Asticcacaulis solisilvae]|uniref:lysozyme n=1 Tax=Asticcacaulis solisilvae TaxID=1217274 RepID=UPI003FD8B6AA
MTESVKPGRGALAVAVGAPAAALLLSIVPAFEGMRNDPYLDIVRVKTVCFGHTGADIQNRHYSDAECRAMLEKDLARHAAPVLACTPQLKGRPYQTAAVVSFAYNAGTTAFCRSGMARDFRRGHDREACAGLSRWIYAGGRRVEGLVRRRAAERALCERGLT